MSAATEPVKSHSRSVSKLAGLTMIGVAAAAMVGTLPGRTQGLGLITEPLLVDLQLDRITYAQMNLWATLLGSSACFPAGRLIDRYGLRAVLWPTALLLGLTVVGMSAATAPALLFVLILCSRGLGQSALSVISITTVGKAFDRRLTWPMAAYGVTLTIGFMIVFPLVESCVKSYGWRASWTGVGAGLLLLVAPSAWLLPARLGRNSTEAAEPTADSLGMTLAAALSTPLFWIFGVATSLFGLAAAGIGLFNESILAERGLAAFYGESLASSALVGLVGQGACGWGAKRIGYRRLATVAMLLYAAALVGLTRVADRGQLLACSALIGAAGGMISVLFFAVWSHFFGRRHLGRIQGAAQMLTVFASAVGPLLFAEVHARTGSYAAVLYGLAATVALVGVVAWFTPVPKMPADTETLIL